MVGRVRVTRPALVHRSIGGFVDGAPELDQLEERVVDDDRLHAVFRDEQVEVPQHEGIDFRLGRTVGSHFRAADVEGEPI